MQFDISRRKFFKTASLASLAVAPAIVGCSGKKETETYGDLPQTDIPTDKMTYRVTPSTKDKVSLLGYGCMRWPTIPDPNDPTNDIIDQEEVNRLVDFALAHGVNYFDTSPAYCKGRSEEATGIALSRHPRDSYFIATKLSNFAPSTWSREKSIEMFENSLKYLRTDHIDYLLLHGIGMGDDALDTFNQRYIDNGILDYLVEQREKGRIRNLGFSYHGDVAIFDLLLSQHDKYKWDFVQIQMNYLDWEHAKEINPRNTNASYLYGELQKRGIPAVIMEPLLGGRLATLPDHLLAEMKQREPEKSAASWAFRYDGTYPGVLTVLSGMTYMDHLQDNLRSFCPLKPLTDDEIAMLHNAAGAIASFPTVGCTDCKYCMPCPYGLNIPGIFAHYNKCVNQGNVPDSPEAENYAKARRAFLVGYDKAVPKLRQASHCTGCNQCVDHCPQKIDIPRELARIDVIAESLRRGTPPDMSRVMAALQKEGVTLAVDNGRLNTYSEHGVKTLMDLVDKHPRVLRDARVADKVVGKAAASLMVLGGVKEVYADTISKPGKEMLDKFGVKNTAGKTVDNVLNATKSDLCPLEKAVASHGEPRDCYEALKSV